MTLRVISDAISNFIFLGLILTIILFAAYKKLNVFDSFISGARSAIPTMLRIMPYLIAMLVAIGMLRASGGIDLIAGWLSPVLSMLGMPSELLPLALVRPFSGSAANGVMAELIQTYGGDNIISRMAATMMGSTETTFYVVAVYFGSVAIRRTRHAIPVGLLADLAGIIAAVIVCRLVFVN